MKPIIKNLKRFCRVYLVKLLLIFILADDLSDELIIIDHGKIITQGTPDELKGKLGEGDILEFKIKEINQRDEIIELATKLDFVQWGKPLGKTRIVINALDGLRRVSEIMDAIKVKMEDISVRKNTFEDVFIDLTGRRLRD